MYCSKCGAFLDDSATFCPKCGTNVTPINAGGGGAVPPIPPVPPTTNAQTAQPQQPYTTQQPQMMPPDSNLVWGILTTILCCLPFGIVSIVYASKVNGLWAAGQFNEARAASKKAGSWAMWSAISAVICWIVGILVWVFVFGGMLYSASKMMEYAQ